MKNKLKIKIKMDFVLEKNQGSVEKGAPGVENKEIRGTEMH